MFNKDYSRKFAIRKLKVTTASVFIGLSFLGASEASAETLKAGVEKEVNYKYVLDSELTEAEKSLIVKELPSGQVSEYETYYMVYKEENGAVLPKTKAIVTDNFDYITAALGAGLVLLALRFSKKRRKFIVSSIFILTAAGTYSVSAIDNVKLAGYDKVFTLKTGEALPETKLEIDKHKFVGYILVDNKKDVMEPCPEDTKKVALDQTKVEDKPQAPVKDIKDTQVEQELGQVNPIVSKGEGLVQEAKPEAHIPVTTSAATQAPVTQVVTDAPVTQTKPEATITEVVTEAPVTKVITEAPVTKVVTETPVTKVVTEAPVTKVITEAPVTRIVTEAPVSRVIAKPGQNLTHEKPELQVVTEAPVSRIITEAPVSRIVTEAPVTKIVTEAPVTRIETEPGTTRVVTEEAKTQVIGKAPALVQVEKPIIPIVTSKSIPLVEEAKPEAPVPTTKAPETTVPTTVATTKAPETTTPTTVATTKAPETTVPTTVATTKAPETTVPTTVATTKAPETTTPTTVATTKVVVDKTKLEAEYGLENNSKQTDKYKYATDDLRNAYDKLLTEANTILANPDATQEQVDEALKLLTEARVKLNGLLVEEKEEKEFTRIIELFDETTQSIIKTEEQKVKFIRTVIKNANTNQTVEEKPWTSDKDFFDLFTPPGIDGYKTNGTDIPKTIVTVQGTPETTRLRLDYTKVTDKTKPELTLTKVEKFDKEKRVKLTYDLKNPDSTYVKAQVKVYDDKGVLVQTVDITNNVAEIANLEHCLPYRFDTVLTYDLANGAGPKEEVVDTENVELVDKKIEFKNLISTELYNVDGTGKATPVTALTEKPANTADYMIKLVDSENKEILLAVSDIVEKDGKFQVSAKMDNLVHYVNDTSSEDFVFEIDKAVVKPDHYSTFKELITAMNAKLDGTFYLSANMIVDSEFAGDAYVSGNFTGSLQSETGKNFSISGMKKPLFNNLAAGSRVSNLEIKDANVTYAAANTGILALTATNSTINNLILKGSLKPGNYTAQFNAGGVAGTASGVKISNSYIDVQISTPSSARYQTHYVGGVFGTDTTNTSVTNLTVNVDINALNSGIYGEAVAGVTGRTMGGVYDKIQVAGKLVAENSSNTIAAIIANIASGTISNVVSGVKVTNGSIGNGSNPMLWMMPMLMPKNIYTIDGVAIGNKQPINQQATPISQDQANKYATDWKLPTGTSSSAGATTGAGTAPTSSSAATYPVDYTKVTGAKEGFATAYSNLAKLLPFYDRKTIVKTANKLADGDKLKSTAITSIVPMKGNDFVTDLYNTTGVDKLLIHFADGKVQEYNLTATGESPNSRITEFKLDNGMLYTPHILKQGTPTTLTDAINELKATGLHTEAIRDVLGINKLEQYEKERLKSFNIDLVKGLYLDDSFNNVKANLEEVLNSIISSQFASITENEAISRYLNSEVKKDKEKILLGLAYLNRWYNIDFGTKNIKDLALYRPDFFGNNSVNVIDYLKEIGGAGYEKLSQQGTAAADLYKGKIAPYTGQDDIYKYLEKNKELFEPTKTVQDWFKESSKVHIVEADKLVESSTNDLYERIKKSPTSHSRWLLPVLTAEKDTIFAVVHTPSISVGSFDRYISPTDIADPAKRQAKVDEIKNTTLPKYAKSLADYYKFWYNSADASVRDKFAEKTVNIFDGMNINNINTQDQAGPWAGRYSDFSYVEDFAGPIGAWFPESKSESAYTDLKTMINMQTSRLLEDTGFATLGHELVHFFDKEILLNGHGHRVGQNVESYATGLLESPSGTGTQGYGLNIMFENGDVLSTVNRNKSRFTKAQDFKEYMNRFYDITYTLDGLEANAILSLDKAKQAEFFEQISTVTNNVLEPDGVTRSRVSDVIKPVTNYANLNITSIEGLINNNLVMKGILNMNGKQEFSTDNSLNNYTEVPLYKPIYAAPATETGVGSLQFRKTAFDVLAEKGWDEGFIKYASNQLANISDKAVLESIFGANFNYQTFRANQFNSRLANVANLKPITVSGSQLDGKALENKIKEIITSNKPTKDKIYDMQVLKENVIKAYLKETNDLRTSIYK